jgi:hypothetical protein
MKHKFSKDKLKEIVLKQYKYSIKFNSVNNNRLRRGNICLLADKPVGETKEYKRMIRCLARVEARAAATKFAK